MPLTRRSRRLGARPDDVWRVVGDPQHLPRWWPRVQRVEADDGEAFTQVLMSDREVAKHFKPGELEKLCSLDFHLREVKNRFKKVGL